MFSVRFRRRVRVRVRRRRNDFCFARQIPLVMLITWLDFGGILLDTVFANFHWNFRMCFLFQHSIVHISGMFDPIDMEWKGGALVGYWVNYRNWYQDWGHCGVTNDLGRSPQPEGEARGLWWASQVVGDTTMTKIELSISILSWCLKAY